MYDAVVQLPWVRLAITTRDGELVGTEFVDDSVATYSSSPGSLAAVVEEQLMAYVNHASFEFDLPIRLAGTSHQQSVWRCMSEIPVGGVRSYGDVAKQLGSCAQAVGNACHANFTPVIVPCHRIVAANALGGFSGDRIGGMVHVKRQLLEHEGAIGALF